MPLCLHRPPTAPNPGTCHYAFRYYDPGSGRWTKRDPLEENFKTGEFNPYAFANNNGIGSWDYVGLLMGPSWDQIEDAMEGEPFQFLENFWRFLDHRGSPGHFSDAVWDAAFDSGEYAEFTSSLEFWSRNAAMICASVEFEHPGKHYDIAQLIMSGLYPGPALEAGGIRMDIADAVITVECPDLRCVATANLEVTLDDDYIFGTGGEDGNTGNSGLKWLNSIGGEFDTTETREKSWSFEFEYSDILD